MSKRTFKVTLYEGGKKVESEMITKFDAFEVLDATIKATAEIMRVKPKDMTEAMMDYYNRGNSKDERKE